MAGQVIVRLPRALLQYWDGPPTIELEGASLAEALQNLETRVPGLAARIQDDQGRIRPHVAILVNGTLVAERDPAAVALETGDTVRIVPAVSGG